MEVRELRIGNLLDRNGLIVKVGSNTILAIDENPEILGEIYKPIPLTEELATKLGFVIGEDDKDSYLIEIGRQSFVLAKTSNGDWMLLYSCNIGIHFAELRILEFIHELQNIVFALTGQELCLKIQS